MSDKTQKQLDDEIKRQLKDEKLWLESIEEQIGLQLQKEDGETDE